MEMTRAKGKANYKVSLLIKVIKENYLKAL
jgi:hypothetical protein